MRKTFRKTRILLTLLIVGIIAGAAYAFTASNTVPATYAGDGSGAITGYSVSAIHYNLGATPTDITSVDLTLDNSAAIVKIKLFAADSWHACTGGPTNWNCLTAGATVLPSLNLDVLAVQ